MSKQSDEEVFCNLCGLSCVVCTAQEGYIGQNQHGGLINAKVVGSYHSTPGNGDGALDDCTEYTFSLCEFCLDYLFCKLKIPVKVFDYISGVEEEWESAENRVKNAEWRRHKEEFMKEFNYRNAARNRD